MCTFSSLNEVICNYNKIQESTYDPTKLKSQSNLRPGVKSISICCKIFKKTVSLDVMVHIFYEDKLVTFLHFDCGCTFQAEVPTNVAQ